MKLLIFGAGDFGKRCLNYFEKTKEETVIGFLDNADKEPIPCGGEAIPVYKPDVITKLEYDMILISNINFSCVRDIKKQLAGLAVPTDKVKALIETKNLWANIRSEYNEYDENKDPRVIWVREYAGYVAKHKLDGAVAECGVYMGDFAYYINKYFPDRKLYLFDTFSGFDIKDIQAERDMGDSEFINGIFNTDIVFRISDDPDDYSLIKKMLNNELVVIKKMLHKDKCIIKKGYFPESASDVNDKFCFVNLDMDLYTPMLAGLEFFYDKMCEGGVILLHDYFMPGLPGVKHAVESFERKLDRKLCKITIGDFCSIAIIKYP